MFGTGKPPPRVGGLVGGVGQYLGRTRALGPPGVDDFSVRRPKGPLGAPLGSPGGDALSVFGVDDFIIIRENMVFRIFSFY